MPEPRRAALAFIFVTLLLDVLGFGMVIPVLPKLVESFTGGDTAEAAAVYGVFGTVWAAMQLLFSPVLGALSDRFGRRPVLLLSITGLGLDYVLMALAPSLGWLFVGRVIAGITAASFSTASAYIADITPPEKRAGAFGLVGAAFGLGFVLGPAMGGLLGAVDLRLPFWVSAALALTNALYGLFVLPESLPPERRTPFRWTLANPFGAVGFLAKDRRLLGLASVNLLYHLAHHALPSTFVLYTGHRYGWNETMVGLTLAGVGVLSIVVQGGLTRPVVQRLGERRAMLLGLACGAAGFAVYGAAWIPALVWVGVVVFAPAGFYSPALQARMTAIVGPEHQGKLQGANSSIMGLTGLLGPGLFTGCLAWSIGPGASWNLPGLPFYVAAALMAAAAMMVLAGAGEGASATGAPPS